MEVGRFPEAIALRDSKDPEGPKLVVTRAIFRELVEGLKR
ncbi:DUF397 domain-containing protein [Spirillospora sp. CA-128828]